MSIAYNPAIPLIVSDDPSWAFGWPGVVLGVAWLAGMALATFFMFVAWVFWADPAERRFASTMGALGVLIASIGIGIVVQGFAA